jgi:hypothetical protein
METPQSTSLVRGWTFRIFLLVAALAGFLGTAADTEHRLQISMHGVPATIELASKTQTLPNNWSNYENRLRAPFFVKIKPDNGDRLSAELFLSKEVVEALLKGETRKIVFAEANPRRFIMQDDPLPPFGVGWLIFGLSPWGYSCIH